MRSCLFALLSLLLTVNAVAAQEAKKLPIPSKEAQAIADKLVDEIYGTRFTKAEKDAIERADLARTLLEEGRLTKDNVAGRYVLLTKAHALAAQAGDVNTALAAADELALSFAIAPTAVFQMKVKMLQQASKAEGAPPDAYQSVIDRVLVTLDDTLDADDYASSTELIAAAEHAARKLKSIPLVVTMRRKQDEIARQQKEFARWAPFAERLAKNAKDGEASYEMGKYYALVKGDFDRGLPLLAAGNSPKLKSLALADLAKKDPPLVVAQDWFAYGTTTKDAALRTQAYLRAYHWYQEALGTANEKNRNAIEANLKTIANQLPPEYRIGEITTEVKKIDIVSGPVYSCEFAPDSRRFLVTGYDNALRIFNAKTYKEIRTLDGHSGKPFAVAFKRDGLHAVSGGFDGTVRLWDLTSGRPIRTFEGHKDYVRSVAISADGMWILSGGDDRTVRLWNVATGKEERTMVAHDHTVWHVAISRDGKRGLSASLDKTVRHWDLEKGETIQKLEGHTDTVLCVAFAPDGRHAVSGSTDKTLRLWDLAKGVTTQVFEGSPGYIQSVAISPDGRRILSAGADHVVRLWDTQTGSQIRTLEGHRAPVWHVAFSRDGRLAISGGQDNSVRIWGGAR